MFLLKLERLVVGREMTTVVWEYRVKECWTYAGFERQVEDRACDTRIQKELLIFSSLRWGDTLLENA